VLSLKDQAIIAQVQDRAQYAVSYVGGAEEMAQARRRAWELLGKPLHLIAKLERGPAVAGAFEIAKHADALWLCRGDLGAEMGLAPMAAAARQFLEKVPALPVPAVIAGQVLEHMTVSPAPTRSEVCYLHDCLAAGYRGLVLSDETATGRYPVESVRAAAMFR
jgi:pyruvate kinase